MKVFHKISDFLYKILRWVTVATVVAMLLLMLVEVVRRYIFSVTFSWSDEVIRYLLVYCAYFGGACAYYKKGMVAFTLITDKLPKKAQAFLPIICNTIMLVLFVFLTYYAFLKATSPAVMNSVSSSSGLSGSVPYISMVIGLGVMAWFSIDFYPELIRDYKVQLAGGKPATAVPEISEANEPSKDISRKTEKEDGKC